MIDKKAPVWTHRNKKSLFYASYENGNFVLTSSRCRYEFDNSDDAIKSGWSSIDKKEPREYYFAKDKLHHYVKSVEVETYPHGFECLVLKSELEAKQNEVDELKDKIKKMKEVITNEDLGCADCVEAKAEGFTMCGDCSCD